MGSAQKNVIKHVTLGENDITHKKINWKKFIHFSLVWLVSVIILFMVSFAFEMVKESKHLFMDVILRVDTLSLMFSLILSIILDRFWNFRNNFDQKVMLSIQLIVCIVGLIFYIIYSIFEITNPQNIYFQSRLSIHILYIILSVIVAFVGFLIDSLE